MDENKNHLEAESASPAQEAPAVASAKKDRFLPISILVAAVLIGGSVVFATLYKGGSGAAQPSANNGQQGPAAVGGSAITTLGARDAVLGDSKAKVTLIEYGDYQCPFCAEFFAQVEPQIIKDYVNTGKVKMVFRNFSFLGPESTAAAEAAECSEDQNKLWAYHDALYAAKVGDEQKGGGEGDGFYNRALFLKLAGQVGMDVAKFTQCIDSNKYASQVAQERTDAANAGVNSTPTFFVNGAQILGAQPYAQFQQVIDAALKA